MPPVPKHETIELAHGTRVHRDEVAPQKDERQASHGDAEGDDGEENEQLEAELSDASAPSLAEPEDPAEGSEEPDEDDGGGAAEVVPNAVGLRRFEPAVSGRRICLCCRLRIAEGAVTWLYRIKDSE